MRNVSKLFEGVVYAKQNLSVPDYEDIRETNKSLLTEKHRLRIRESFALLVD